MSGDIAASKSQRLESFLCRVIWQPTEAQRARDPGVPISAELAREAAASLTQRQRTAIDGDALATLTATLVDVTVDRQTYRGEVRFDKTAPMLAARKLGAAPRGATYVTWAVTHSMILGNFAAAMHHVLSNETVGHWLHNAMLVLRQLKLALTLEQYYALIDCDRASLDRQQLRHAPFAYFSAPLAIDALLANSDAWAITDDDRADVRKIRAVLAERAYSADDRRRLAALDRFIGGETVSPLWDGEPWARAVGRSLAGMPPALRRPWAKLLNVAGTCNPTKPSKPWLAEAAASIAALPDGTLAPQLEAWIRGYVLQMRGEGPTGDARGKYAERMTNAVHLTGLIQLTNLAADARLPRLLADLIEQISRSGREARVNGASVGAAAVRALAAGATDESLAQLSRLELRIRWPKLKKLVRKELDAAINRRNLDRADVEESLIPDFSLRDGAATLPFDGFTAQLTLGRADKPSVTWTFADGKPARTLPPKLKAANPIAADEVKQTVTDIERMRAAQRTRLDLLLRRPRTWPISVWRERYLDHGLVGTLARRLIWLIDDTAALWRDGALVDVAGQPVPLSGAAIRLWHPAQRPVDEVVAWRVALESWEIVQPFKQAHREIYLLTDAERRTDTYSNRFAAHVLRAMTLLSISQVRQWKSGMYGGASSPSFDLPDYGLRAEWWLQPAGDDVTSYGAPLYLASDQVRFVCTSDEVARRYGHRDLAAPLPLDLVPSLAFSEILRDVDLFVALASVGNDPNWSDGGPGNRFRDYWHSYSFGDLTESAKTRKAALDRLVPRLAIRDRCRVADKFLYVRGDLRTYKIHLGSGNILMEPNDQYLCIVPDAASRKGGDVFLPFEGDATLSVILSKAFLLAADAKITDPTITRQIGQR